MASPDKVFRDILARRPDLLSVTNQVVTEQQERAEGKERIAELKATMLFRAMDKPDGPDRDSAISNAVAFVAGKPSDQRRWDVV